MGVFSTFNRFREMGQAPNVNNMARFGEPVCSLFTSTKVFSLHHHIDITDEVGNIVYQSNSKVFSLHDRTTLSDAGGAPVAEITRKLFSLHERHFIHMSDGVEFELSNELLHIIKDVTNVEGLGWQIQGNILGLNFEIYDVDGSVIAVIGQKLLSIHDKYCIDIYKPQHEEKVIAILVTLQHMIRDREASSSSSSSSSSSGN